MNAKLSKVNQSIEKTIQIVEVMARGKGPMRLQDVAKKCGMPASTVMRMLNTLQVYGYVNQDPCTQHYSLSLRFARLGCLVSEQTNMRDVGAAIPGGVGAALSGDCVPGV
ncbi:MAG: helix-turn-helix domain-containing protein [Flavonifractor plautii]